MAGRILKTVVITLITVRRVCGLIPSGSVPTFWVFRRCRSDNSVVDPIRGLCPPLLANPDLPVRLEPGAALNVPDTETFYQVETLGYTDYPTLEHLPS